MILISLFIFAVTASTILICTS